MTVIKINNHKYVHLKGAPPSKEVLEAFDGVLAEYSKTPWLIVLIDRRCSATPINAVPVAGVHPAAWNVEDLLRNLKSYFSRTYTPGMDYGKFEIWAEKPARGLLSFERPAPDITGEGTVGKVLDETLLFMKNRGIEKAYIEMDGKRVGTLSQKYIQQFIG